MRRALCALVIVVSGLLVAIPPAGTAAADGSCSAATPCYYLALGDSLAEGYQPDSSIKYGFGHGYADVLEKSLMQKYPNGAMQLANLGCVDETSSTMLGLNGTNCPNSQYTTYGITTTPQITLALNFLQDHPGQVRLITIDIGVNDMLQALTSSTSITQVVSVLTQVQNNFDQILTDLQQQASATQNGNVRIVTMTYYNPLVVSSSSVFVTLAGQIFANKIKNIAQQHGISVADVYQAFNGGAHPTPIICQLTWYCSTTHPGDPHPHTLGYALIAALFWQAGVDSV